MRDKKVQLELLLRDWYKPNKRGEAARLLLMDHDAWFKR